MSTSATTVTPAKSAWKVTWNQFIIASAISFVLLALLYLLLRWADLSMPITPTIVGVILTNIVYAIIRHWRARQASGIQN